ncbi:hypothetical protein FSP39_011853 [Pinctada imbricata]|uniref:Uncharacterized protein n=1 Tax=Pinctada imbricata TaxID=66713 RepID=A0AA89CBS7_PINIB|nr:hypothetical protein FSP39_011853 [Pinctada imbricata]
MEPPVAAFVLSPEEDILSHGHVFYNLVRPRRDTATDTVMLESSDGAVNVVPRKRIYRMESLEELEDFQGEILRRPLVVQPLLKIGSGIQMMKCFFCINEERWAILINQTHPKVLGRILMGMDVAKRAIRSGQNFVLEFNFGDIIRRFYNSIMAQNQQTRFSYMDCEFADLIIVYNQRFAARGQQARRLQFCFDDIEGPDVTVRRVELAEMEQPDSRFRVIPQEHYREILPGWTFADEMDEEIDYNYHNSGPSTTNQNNGTRAGNPRRSGRQMGRTRSQRQEVTVDLHAPGGTTSANETSFSDIGRVTDNEMVARNSDGYGASVAHVDSEWENHSVPRFLHSHQNSGGGRSSMADSGYQDDDVDLNGLDRNRLLQGYHGNRYTDFSSSDVIVHSDKDRLAYDNAAFHDFSDSEIDVPSTSQNNSYRERRSFDQGYEGTPLHRHDNGSSQIKSTSRSEESSMYFQTIDQMNANSKKSSHVSESVLI